MGSKPGYDTDDAANALFSIYFHCERGVVTNALRAMGRQDAQIPQGVLPSRYRILPMDLAVQTLRSSQTDPEFLAFAVAILTRSLPTTGDLSSTAEARLINDLLDTLSQQSGSNGPAHRLSDRLQLEFKEILGPPPPGQRTVDRGSRAYKALFNKDLGPFELKIGDVPTRIM